MRRTWRIAAVPDRVREALVDRLERHVEAHWRDRRRGIVVRFRNEYAYVEAQPPEEDEPPVRLARLEYRGRPDEWGLRLRRPGLPARLALNPSRINGEEH